MVTRVVKVSLEHKVKLVLLPTRVFKVSRVHRDAKDAKVSKVSRAKMVLPPTRVL